MDRRNFVKYTTFILMAANACFVGKKSFKAKPITPLKHDGDFIIVNNYLLKKEDIENLIKQGWDA